MVAAWKAILFDIDGTLIDTGGAGAASWRLAFDEMYGIPVDIGEFTDTGMTDPDVGQKTFQAVLHRPAAPDEFARLLDRRMHYLRQTVTESTGYRILPGALELLSRLITAGYLLGLVTGNLESAAHIKLHRRTKPLLLLRRLRLGRDRSRRSDQDRPVASLPGLWRCHRSQRSASRRRHPSRHRRRPRSRRGVAWCGSHHFTADQLRDSGADYVASSLEHSLPF